MKRSTMQSRLALCLATLALAGCATLTPGQTSAPATKGGAIRALPAIKYNSYCEAQKAIAEHNSRRDTLRTGKRVVYKAPCELVPKAREDEVETKPPPPQKPPAEEKKGDGKPDPVSV